MSLWKTHGESNAVDTQVQRIGMGTVGGDHVVQRSLTAGDVSSLIDDSSPSIVYGLATAPGAGSFASFDFFATTDFVTGGTETILGGLTGSGTPGAAAQLFFQGTSIAVLGSTNPNSGNMRVYIDGVAKPGRVPIYAGIRLPSIFSNTPIGAADTTIPALAQALSFPATGTMYLGGELITYTSRDGNGFYGCTRGTGGTTATIHTANETIYLWDNSIGLYSATDYATKQVLYYNPFLSPGPHKITIVAETNTTSTFARIYFDGFVTGPLLGARNIFTQIATFTISGTTDGNGHFDIGSITASNNDVARLAFIGMSQKTPDCESSNTNTMAKLGVKYNLAGTPLYYLHNGPASSAFVIILTFAFIGEALH